MIQDIAHLREKVCAASHLPLFFVVDNAGRFPDFVFWFAATGDVGPEQCIGLHCSYRGSNLPLNALLLIDCATLVLTDIFFQKAGVESERRTAEHLRKDVESYRRDLSECRSKLQTSEESNTRMSRYCDVAANY